MGYKNDMTFKAYIFHIVKHEISNTKILALSGFVFLVFGVIFYYLFKNTYYFIPGIPPVWTLIVIGSLVMVFSQFYQFYDFEKIIHEKVGFLELGSDELILNYTEKIKYGELTDFEMVIDAYYNEKINITNRAPEEKRSLGISNTLKINYQSKTRTFNFKLENESHKNVLERNIYELVIHEKLKNIDAKKSIKLIPERYRKYEEYREYVGKQLKASRINCTEGLLLIGYNTYEEAQELKKKYCD